MMSVFVANEPATGGGLSMILIFVAVIAIMYFLMIRPEKKKQKKVEAMRDALKVGDNITTIGGIVGDVVSIKDGKDGKIVIETSADRVRMELEKWSVSTNNTATAAARKAAIESRKAAEERKKAKKSK